MAAEGTRGDLRRQIEDAIRAETDSAGVDVNVDVQDQTVRLHGVVDTLSQKEAAAAIARRVAGDRRVQNDLTVGFEQGWDDEQVREAVQRRLAGQSTTRTVSVQVEDGAAILMGRTDEPAGAEQAQRMAAGIPGVGEIRNRVTMEPEEDADAAAAQAAMERLRESGRDPGQFTLWAEGGTLHIRGLVKSPAEAQAIEQMLRQVPGVQQVEALLPQDPEEG